MSIESSHLLEDLADPSAYPDRPRAVDVVETRRSWLFVAGSSVYKLRKPWQVGRFDLTDYRTRLEVADEELRLNRRLSPELYVGVVPVTRDGAGRLRVQGEGELVDWAVQRSWVPERATLAVALAEGVDLAPFWDDLARRLAQFHQRVPTGPQVTAYGDAAVLERADLGRLETLRQFVRTADVSRRVELPLLSGAQWEGLRAKHEEVFAQAELFLRGRVKNGGVRDVHGALEIGHLFLHDGRAWAVGANVLEPTERFADVMRDVANLALDLQLAGHGTEAEAFLEAYRRRSGEQQFSVLLDFYRRERGLVWALRHAEAALEADGEERARHATQATTLLVGAAAQELDACLLWVGGLPGAWDDDELARVAATQGATLIPVRENATALQRAEAELRGGRGAFLVGGFLTADDRRALGELAGRTGVPFVPIHAEASEADCLDRLVGPGAVMNDRNLGTWLRAKRRFERPDELAGTVRWDASDRRRTLDAVLFEARLGGGR